MIDIPFPLMHKFADNIVYMSSAGAIVLALIMLGWGWLLSRLILGVTGAGAGALFGAQLAGWIKVDPIVGRSAAGSILGVLGFVAAPFFWAILAGSLCSLVAGGFVAADFLTDPGITITPLQAGASPEMWVDWIIKTSESFGGELWQKRAGVLVIAMAPAGIIPMLIGFWRQRFITIVTTAFIGAVLATSGAVLAMVQADPARWPKEWSGLMIPLYVAGGLWLFSVAVQYNFALASERKKKGKEIDRARPAGESSGNR